jgi:hypothetical protein
MVTFKAKKKRTKRAREGKKETELDKEERNL